MIKILLICSMVTVNTVKATEDDPVFFIEQKILDRIEVIERVLEGVRIVTDGTKEIRSGCDPDSVEYFRYTVVIQEMNVIGDMYQRELEKLQGYAGD